MASRAAPCGCLSWPQWMARHGWLGPGARGQIATPSRAKTRRDASRVLLPHHDEDAVLCGLAAMQNGYGAFDAVDDDYLESYHAYPAHHDGSADLYEDPAFGDQYDDPIGTCMHLYARNSVFKVDRKEVTRHPPWYKLLMRLKTTTTCFLMTTLPSLMPRRPHKHPSRAHKRSTRSSTSATG